MRTLATAPPGGITEALGAGLWLCSLVVFREPLVALLALALDDYRYSQVLAAPAIGGALLWMKRAEFAAKVRPAPVLGAGLVLAGLVMASFGGSLTAAMAAVLLAWCGIAVGCYGPGAMRTVLFPLSLFALLIPPPVAVMDGLTVAVQRASADVTAALFRLADIPYERDGLFFALEGVNIEIAEACSGIRSTLMTVIGAAVAAHFLLRSTAGQLTLVLLCIPAVIFKNAARIAAITWLGQNVDAGFFTGTLHKFSGIPFSLLTVALLVPAVWALRRAER